MPSSIAALRLAKVKVVEVQGTSSRRPANPTTTSATFDIVTTRDGLDTRKHMESEIDTFFGGAPLTKPRIVSLPISKPSTIVVSKKHLDALPPAYTPPNFDDVFDEKLPEYEEPNTLPRQLFFYGFLFMPLWFIGISFIISKLNSTEDWAADKTPLEQERMLAIIRRSEVKWAKRCLIAALAFTLALITVLCIFRFYIMQRT